MGVDRPTIRRHVIRVPGTARWCLSHVGQEGLLTLKGVRLSYQT
jgi:hypothetical protein